MDDKAVLKQKKYFILAMAVLLALQLAALFYYGNKKAGFHEDELYTYYSSNKTAGLFVNDRQWMERDDLRNDFVVLPGEGFRYDVVWQMQSWDVHPPLYYFVFHTVCSLFPGLFSKWLGIGVNLFFFAGSYVLLAYCAYTAAVCGREGSFFRVGAGREGQKPQSCQRQECTAGWSPEAGMLSFLTCLFWGFSAAVISGVMFIRMYQQLTFFVLLCLMLHLRALKRQDFRIRSFFLPLSVTVFLGFLTQYYYIIFHVFLGAGFCAYLLWGKKIKALVSYVIACGAGLFLALLYYPPALSHIFRGYRGTEAVSEFGDASNTLGRLRFFAGLFDDYVLNGTLSIWILILVLAAVTAGYLRKKGSPSGRRLKGERKPAAALMLFAAAGYFFTVSKTALLLGETSNRYQLPIYGILCFLLLYGAWGLAEGLAGSLAERAGKIMAAVLLAALLLIDMTALVQGKVFFLYEEEKEIMEFVKEHKDVPVVVFYKEESGEHIWWLSDELMEYPKVYLAGMGNGDPITDEAITQSNSLVVYAADPENSEQSLKELLAANENLSSYRAVAEKGRGVWTLYEVR